MWQTQSAGPVRTAHMCCWLWTLCHTTQHGAVLIIFPLNLQTITITRMLSSGGEGARVNNPNPNPNPYTLNTVPSDYWQTFVIARTLVWQKKKSYTNHSFCQWNSTVHNYQSYMRKTCGKTSYISEKSPRRHLERKTQEWRNSEADRVKRLELRSTNED